MRWIGCLLLVVASSPVSAQLAAHASAERVWVARRVPGTDGRAGSLTLVLQRDVGLQGEWREAHRDSLRVVDLAHRGTDAAIVTENGSWRLVSPGYYAAPVPLPEGVLMRRIASMPGVLLALGEVVSAPRLATRPVVQGGGSRPPTTGASPAFQVGDWVLFRLSGNRWSVLSILDEPLRPRPGEEVSLTTHAGTAVLAVAHHDGKIHLARVEDHGNKATLPAIESSRLRSMKLLGGLPRLTLAVEDDRGTMRLLALAGDAWETLAPLALDPRMAAARWRAAAAVGGNVVVFAEHEGRLLEQSFTPAGQPLGDAREIEPRVPGQRGQAEYWLNLVIMIVLLVVMFTTLRQRPMPGLEQMRERRLTLAPHSLRLLAGLIDAVPAVAASIYVAWRTGNEQSALEVLSATELAVVGLLSATYPLHTAIGELVAGRSLGKLLCGLRVCDVSGGAAKPGAILVRNFVRVPDVLLVFPLAFILLSPLRQRVGDMAAGTIVVRDTEESDPSPGPTSDEQE